MYVLVITIAFNILYAHDDNQFYANSVTSYPMFKAKTKEREFNPLFVTFSSTRCRSSVIYSESNSRTFFFLNLLPPSTLLFTYLLSEHIRRIFHRGFYYTSFFFFSFTFLLLFFFLYFSYQEDKRHHTDILHPTFPLVPLLQGLKNKKIKTKNEGKIKVTKKRRKKKYIKNSLSEIRWISLVRVIDHPLFSYPPVLLFSKPFLVAE